MAGKQGVQPLLRNG